MSDAMSAATSTANGTTPPPAAARDAEPPKKKKKMGGVRPGSGRPPGSANKIKGAVLKRMYASASIELEAKDPSGAILEFLEKVLRHNGIDVAVRMTAARELAPYVMSKAPTLSVTAEASLSAQHLEAVANMGRGANAGVIDAEKAPKRKPEPVDTKPSPLAAASVE
jgi:hypothetical protein